MDKKQVLNDVYKKLLAEKKIRNRTDFAKLLGVNYNNLTGAMRGDERLLTAPLFEKLEAITGTDDDLMTDSIPLLPTVAIGGSLNEFEEGFSEYDCERVITPVKGAQIAMMVRGDSMAPVYPSGSQVLLSQIDESAFIEWGKVYVLDTINGTIIKKVTEGEDGRIICESLNRDYPSFSIDRKHIRGWWRILMVMTPM